MHAVHDGGHQRAVVDGRLRQFAGADQVVATHAFAHEFQRTLIHDGVVEAALVCDPLVEIRIHAAIEIAVVHQGKDVLGVAILAQGRIDLGEHQQGVGHAQVEAVDAGHAIRRGDRAGHPVPIPFVGGGTAAGAPGAAVEGLHELGGLSGAAGHGDGRIAPLVAVLITAVIEPGLDTVLAATDAGSSVVAAGRRTADIARTGGAAGRIGVREGYLIDGLVRQGDIVALVQLGEDVLERIVIHPLALVGTRIRQVELDGTGVLVQGGKVGLGDLENLLPVAAAAIDGVVLRAGPVDEGELVAVAVHVEVVTEVLAARRVSAVVEAETADQGLHVGAVHHVGTRAALTRTEHMRLDAAERLDLLVIDGETGGQALGLLTGHGSIGDVAVPAAELVVLGGAQRESLSVDIGKGVRLAAHDLVEVLEFLEVGYQRVADTDGLVALAEDLLALALADVEVLGAGGIESFLLAVGGTVAPGILGILDIGSEDRRPEPADGVDGAVALPGLVAVVQRRLGGLSIGEDEVRIHDARRAGLQELAATGEEKSRNRGQDDIDYLFHIRRIHLMIRK